MFGFGVWEVILVLAIILLFFGGKKIPQLARGLGSAIRNFKGEIGSGDDEESGASELPREDPKAHGLPPEGDRDDR